MQHHADKHSHGEGQGQSQNDADNRQRGDARRQDNAGPSSFAGGGRRKGDRLHIEGEFGAAGLFKKLSRRFWATGCRRRSQGLRLIGRRMRRGRGYLARGGPLASRRIIEEFVKIAALKQLRLSRGFRRRPLMRLFGRLGRWIRHDHLTGTSQASANSRRLWNRGSHGTERPLRVKDIFGPTPRPPAGGWGVLGAAAAMPGVTADSVPKVSEWMRE